MIVRCKYLIFLRRREETGLGKINIIFINRVNIIIKQTFQKSARNCIIMLIMHLTNRLQTVQETL